MVEKLRNATLTECHHHLVGHVDAYLRHVTQTTSMRPDVEYSPNPTLWEMILIIFNVSVKWELTTWPLMDMENVAVSTLVAGPR